MRCLPDRQSLIETKIRSEEEDMQKLKGQSGPGAEGFTLASVLSAFAALGEAFEAAAEVRQGKERLALAGAATDLAARHGGAAEAYDHAAQQLLDLVASLEEEDAPWDRGLSRPDPTRAEGAHSS
jgi:hypothetical protein